MRQVLTHEDGVAAVYGGGVLGGGGGGHLDEGLALVDEIFADGARIELISPDELSPEDTVACVALVGAPSAVEAHSSTEQMVGAVRDLEAALGSPLAALMTNENGFSTTINGWAQAAALGLPVIDAPANGRAHPTGVMGSLGLHAEPEYLSAQAYGGGRGDKAISGFTRGSLGNSATVVRQASVVAGGMVGVCRNPVPVSRLTEHGAPGAIALAIEVGRAWLAGGTGAEKIANVVERLGGRIELSGTVESVELRQEGGFDVGEVVVDGAELTFWNEYMTLEIEGRRLSTFPDLIMTMDSATGTPIISARAEVGQDLTVLSVDRSKLILGSTMRDEGLMRGIEPILGKSMVA